MKDHRSHLAKLLGALVLPEGPSPTVVPGVHCTKFSSTDRRTKRRWRACLGIVAQGAKEVVLNRDIFRCDEGRYTATPVALPVVSRVSQASADRPFLGVLIDLDPLILSEVAVQIEKDFPRESEAPLRAMYTGSASEKILEATIRLVQTFASPEEAAVVGPLIIREIFFHLLRGPEGASIRQFVRSGTKTHKISHAIFQLESQLNEDIDVEGLAKAANMSRSGFFKTFKDVTAMSPIQYQKRLRLLEAKRLMIEDGQTAESSAYRVGYRSASQFSREYSRMFGSAPRKDTLSATSSRPNDYRGPSMSRGTR